MLLTHICIGCLEPFIINSTSPPDLDATKGLNTDCTFEWPHVAIAHRVLWTRHWQRNDNVLKVERTNSEDVDERICATTEETDYFVFMSILVVWYHCRKVQQLTINASGGQTTEALYTSRLATWYCSMLEWGGERPEYRRPSVDLEAVPWGAFLSAHLATAFYQHWHSVIVHSV